MEHRASQRRNGSVCCTYEGVRYEFASGKAAETLHDQAPAIRILFRRRCSRSSAVRNRALNSRCTARFSCIAQVGPLRFEAQLADIMPDGLVAIVYDRTIRIESGTRLNGVEVAFGPKVIKLDMELRHFTRLVLPSGASAVRAGCRIVGAQSEVERFVRHFLKELDPGGS